MAEGFLWFEGRLAHGPAASCWLFLTIAETRQGNELSLCNRYLAAVVV